MSGETPRRPVAFALPSTPSSKIAAPDAGPQAKRRPQTAKARSDILVDEEPSNVFNELGDNLDVPAAALARPRLTAGRILAWTIGLLVSLALALWTDALVSMLFDRAGWLGWTGLVLVAVALAALAAVAAREWIALRRLDLVTLIREEAALAYASDDETQARAIIEKLSNHLKSQPETAGGRRLLEETKGEIVDGRDLIRLAETGLLAPLDAKAAALVMNAAKRVSVVTAVSPRALVDIGYILFESFRLIRQLCELYGNRPASLGLLRLARNVVAHLAVTGSVAMGDSLVQQMLGHGIAAKLSARLGEGIINGLMTARIGIAAMDIVRPLPFNSEKRPGIGGFLSELTKVGTPKAAS